MTDLNIASIAGLCESFWYWKMSQFILAKYSKSDCGNLMGRELSVNHFHKGRRNIFKTYFETFSW